MKQASELLSALLDGELNAAEIDRLLDKLDINPELKSDWSRLCYTKAAIQGQRPMAPVPGFIEGVMSALGEAPMHDALASKSRPLTPAVASGVLPRRSRASRRTRAWQVWGGLAAASVAGLVTLSFSAHQPALSTPTMAAAGDDSMIVAVADRRPSSAEASSHAAIIPVAYRGPSASPEYSEAARSLDDISSGHSNDNPIQGMGNDMSFVRGANYSASGQQDNGSH